jgi:lactate dehydrogenase-like 2-hydroxyacid dehydrogenase
VTRPDLLMIGPYPAWDMEALEAAYRIHRLWEVADKPAWLAAHGAGIRAIATRGDLICSAEVINALPNVEIIGCYGVGTDGIDFSALRPRGIKVTNTPDVLTDDVADLAIGLMIAIARLMPQGDAHVRKGLWKSSGLPLATRFSGKRLGIAGLGRIGMAIARRAEAFEMDISYYSRSEKPGISYRRIPSVVELAGTTDFLVAAVAAGPATTKLINREVLQALGPQGYFINVARGAVVDEEALLAALTDKTIKGAALDVFVNEPDIDQRFFTLDNVVLQPHVGSATVETRQAMGKLVRDNLAAHFAGRPLLTEVR